MGSAGVADSFCVRGLAIDFPHLTYSFDAQLKGGFIVLRCVDAGRANAAAADGVGLAHAHAVGRNLRETINTRTATPASSHERNQ